MSFDFLKDDSFFNIIIRDPVWKDISFTPEFIEITRSEPFLRLYRIRQLGPTELVYPGATHTRAAHSLGVYHLSLRILKVLALRGADSWITEIGSKSFLAAALLHDLGHFPYTHSLKELPLLDHEQLTARIILIDPLPKLLTKAGANPEMTAAIVDHTTITQDVEILFFRKLLSGVLDPDKLDYLNRDASYCGVPYGIQDTDFIISKLQCDKNRGIIIDSSAIMSIESILFSKYLMYRSVYWNRQVRIATAMMKKALYGALTTKLVLPEELYPLDDPGIHQIFEKIDSPYSDLTEQIRSRKFFKIVAEYPFNESDKGMIELENLEKRTDMERELAEKISNITGMKVSSEQVLIDIPERISFESDLYIFDEKKNFNESSTVFNQSLVKRFTQSLRKLRIAVAPIVEQKLFEIPDISEKLANYIHVDYTK